MDLAAELQEEVLRGWINTKEQTKLLLADLGGWLRKDTKGLKRFQKF